MNAAQYIGVGGTWKCPLGEERNVVGGGCLLLLVHVSCVAVLLIPCNSESGCQVVHVHPNCGSVHRYGESCSPFLQESTGL